MPTLRAGQIWTDLHPARKNRVIQVRVVASDFVVVTSSNNRTTRINRSSFSEHPKCRLRYEYVSHQPQPKVNWDGGLEATANDLRRFVTQAGDSHEAECQDDH